MPHRVSPRHGLVSGVKVTRSLWNRAQCSSQCETIQSRPSPACFGSSHPNFESIFQLPSYSNPPPLLPETRHHRPNFPPFILIAPRLDPELIFLPSGSLSLPPLGPFSDATCRISPSEDHHHHNFHQASQHFYTPRTCRKLSPFTRSRFIDYTALFCSRYPVKTLEFILNSGAAVGRAL
jgi:hypothetical protein